MTHPFMLLLSVFVAAFITGVANDCDQFRGYEVGFSFNRRIHRFRFEGTPIDLYGQLAEQAEFQTLTTVEFTKRGHVLLAYNNELVELRFDVEHDESTDADGKKKQVIVSPQSSVALERSTCATQRLSLASSGDPSTAASTSFRPPSSVTCWSSETPITTGEETFIDPELNYSTGDIFDLATGQAYDTTFEKNSRLIGVIRGQMMHMEPCGGGNRTVVESVTYDCEGGDCSKRHNTLLLDSIDLKCFILDGCEIAFGPQTIFTSVAVIPTKPVTRDEMFATTTEKFTTAQHSTSDGTAQPSKTESTANSAASTTSEPETTTPMTDEEHSAVYRRLRYGEHHSPLDRRRHGAP
ncbi:hypothetical protein L596_025708 [Steinernema carpocapsae]|uniref:Uncharacterized protein n=1 Tax=Steinernema carpocapsae TaxID=34508 RepID=A0A4U5M8K0_STECR|nr:hypothetical protein L596_025708 [Steinernema carpocapsae]